MPEAEPTKPQELTRLRKRLLRALYVQPNTVRARVCARQMKKALEAYRHIEATLLGRDCLALVAEARGQSTLAIKHRMHQLELLDIVSREARNIAESNSREIVAKTLASDRITVLAFLTLSMWSLGKLQAALKQLTAMKRVCMKFGLEFWGREIQSDIRQQLKEKMTKKRVHRRVPRSEKAQLKQLKMTPKRVHRRVPRSEKASHVITAQIKRLAA